MKTNYIKYILFFAISFFSLITYSQVELKNKVVDFGTLLPIEATNIYIQNTTIGTISNSDGKFELFVPKKHENDTLIISSIGYKSFKTPVNKFDNAIEIYLEEDIASLDEVLLFAETRPKTGNDIVLRALKELPENLPDSSYIEKGFLRHKERNTKEFKWLIESAITLYDSSYESSSKKNLKINVDQVRKSYDLRDVDSLFTYASYLKDQSRNFNIKSKNLKRDTIKTSSLVKAIKWNDDRINGLENLFQGKLNLLRNSNTSKALFNSEEILKKHQFILDTILVDNEREIYKIKITKGDKYIGLGTKGIYNEGFHANGWIYIYWDNYAIKQIEYELIAASDAQKKRSKTLFGTNINHKLVISYIDINDKMYPKYVYYETPKLVNVGLKAATKDELEDRERYNKEERYYYTVQEVLFSEIIIDQEKVQEVLTLDKWDSDIFSPKPYNKEFWENYNTLLESEEDEKLIQDLTRRSTLYKE